LPNVMPTPTELADLPRLRRPALVNAAEYWLRLPRFTERLGVLGDRFVVEMPGTGPWLCLTHPDDVQSVFRAPADAAHFAEALRMLSPHELVLGDSALTSLDGDVHLAKRRMLLPAFNADALERYEPTIEEKARELAQRWPTGVPTAAHEHAQYVTLEIIMAAIFGVTDPERLDRLRAAILDLTREIGSWRFLAQMAISNARNDSFKRPFPRIERLKRAVDEIVLEEVDRRRRSGELGDRDVLASFLAVRDENGAPLSDREVCDQMRLLLIGGHDTTAATLSWVIERLVHHPEVLARLEETVLDGDDSYLDAVIRETLRLRPVFPFTVRLAKQPIELDGLTVQPGTIVVPCIALVHRRPEIYPDPDEFRPERFLGVRPGTYSWIPFGGGMRRCIGAAMALLETRVIMRTLVQELALRPASSQQEPMRRKSILIVPKAGALVEASRRPRVDVAVSADTSPASDRAEV
jgi:cytochrome P450 family 135